MAAVTAVLKRLSLQSNRQLQEDSTQVLKQTPIRQKRHTIEGCGFSRPQTSPEEIAKAAPFSKSFNKTYELPSYNFSYKDHHGMHQVPDSIPINNSLHPVDKFDTVSLNLRSISQVEEDRIRQEALAQQLGIKLESLELPVDKIDFNPEFETQTREYEFINPQDLELFRPSHLEITNVTRNQNLTNNTKTHSHEDNTETTQCQEPELLDLAQFHTNSITHTHFTLPTEEAHGLEYAPYAHLKFLKKDLSNSTRTLDNLDSCTLNSNFNQMTNQFFQEATLEEIQPRFYLPELDTTSQHHRQTLKSQKQNRGFSFMSTNSATYLAKSLMRKLSIFSSSQNAQNLHDHTHHPNQHNNTHQIPGVLGYNGKIHETSVGKRRKLTHKGLTLPTSTQDLILELNKNIKSDRISISSSNLEDTQEIIHELENELEAEDYTQISETDEDNMNSQLDHLDVTELPKHVTSESYLDKKHQNQHAHLASKTSDLSTKSCNTGYSSGSNYTSSSNSSNISQVTDPNLQSKASSKISADLNSHASSQNGRKTSVRSVSSLTSMSSYGDSVLSNSSLSFSKKHKTFKLNDVKQNNHNNRITRQRSHLFKKIKSSDLAGDSQDCTGIRYQLKHEHQMNSKIVYVNQ